MKAISSIVAEVEQSNHPKGSTKLAVVTFVFIAGLTSVFALTRKRHRELAYPRIGFYRHKTYYSSSG